MNYVTGHRISSADCSTVYSDAGEMAALSCGEESAKTIPLRADSAISHHWGCGPTLLLNAGCMRFARDKGVACSIEGHGPVPLVGVCQISVDSMLEGIIRAASKPIHQLSHCQGLACNSSPQGIACPRGRLVSARLGALTFSENTPRLGKRGVRDARGPRWGDRAPI